MKTAIVYSSPGCEACKTIIRELMRDDIRLLVTDESQMPDDVRKHVLEQQNGALPGIVMDGRIVAPKDVLCGKIP